MAPELALTDTILQFTVLVTVVLAVQLTLERLHIPGLIGLLAVGMTLGPGGLGVMPREPVVELLGSIGLVYIMFMAGLEIDFEIVKAHREEAIGFGLLAFGCSLAPAAGVGLVMGYGWTGALLLGAALSSHTLLAYPIVRKLRLLHHRPVVAALGGTLITDTLALVLLAIVIQTAGGDNGNGSWWMPLLLLTILTAVCLAFLPRFSNFFFQHAGATQAGNALYALVVLMVLSATAELIGAEKILGAFLAGICLNRPLRGRGILREHVEFVGRMLFIPFFFVETGMRLELDVFRGAGQVWTLTALLFGAVLLGKTAAAWISSALFGYLSSARVLMIGLSVPQAAATLAVVLTAAQAGVFGKDVVDAIIIVMFGTCVLGPLLARVAGKRLAEKSSQSE